MAAQKFESLVKLTEEQVGSLPSLEPAFEHLLRDTGLEESTIQAIRHCEIKDRETFSNLADTAEELKTLAADMGMDVKDGGMPHRREYARVLTAWKKCRTQVEVKVNTEALQKQHGEPIRMLPEDWTSVMVHFKSKYGNDLQKEELPAQAYFEEFQEKLSAGMLQAEPLSQMISQAEAEEQERKKPDPPRQYGLHLNASLTIQTRRRYTSTEPKDIEELRAKYDLLSNCWLLGQQRQPGRSIYADLSPTTFPRILKELLGKKNFALKKELEGKPLVAPQWSHCLSYEFELRKEAYDQCREKGIGIEAAWWAAYRSEEHRMTHWLQLVSLANSAPSSGEQQMWSQVRKEIADLRAQVKRSRSPRGKGKGQGRGSRTLLNIQPLALPAPPSAAPATPKASAPKRKGRGKGKQSDGWQRPTQGATWSFQDLMRGGPATRALFHARNDQNRICYAFQESKCDKNPCTREHICIGCGGARPYNSCHCLQNAVAGQA